MSSATGFWPHVCSLDVLGLEVHLWRVQGKGGNKSCLLFQILPIYVIKGLSLQELWSVFLWPLFAIRNSVNVTSTPASPVEGDKKEGCWNARWVIQLTVSPQGKTEGLVTKIPSCDWSKSLPVSETLACIDNP